MNEKINIINLENSGEKISVSVNNIEESKTSIELNGIKDVNLGNATGIYINNNTYKEINIGQNGGKIIGNSQAQEFINNRLSHIDDNAIYINGIRFVPDYIIVDGISKMVLAAEE